MARIRIDRGTVYTGLSLAPLILLSCSSNGEAPPGAVIDAGGAVSGGSANTTSSGGITHTFVNTSSNTGAVTSGGAVTNGGASTSGGAGNVSSGGSFAPVGGSQDASGGKPSSSGGSSSTAAGGRETTGGRNSISGGAAAQGGRSQGGGVNSGGELASGGKASGGSTASAGAPSGTAGASSCPSDLLGWATVNGDGVNTTTGGGNAAAVRPTTPQQLMDYASDDAPRVIEVAGNFAVPRLQVNSNKTLIGIGKDATINGGVRIRGSSSEPVSNVIIRNLRVNGATTQVDNDAMQIYFAHHVWIDHSEIWDGPDGNLDMTHAVNWVTVSWTKFRYTTAYQRPSGEDADHRFSTLIGHSDNNSSEDTGRLKITFHHNWWAERVLERMPRVRFGQVHVFNNYFSSAGNNYCVRAGVGAALLVENNFFDGVKSPHEFNSDEDQKTANITVRGNVYQNTSGVQATGGGGPAFTSAPYPTNMDAANGIKDLVQSCAGPR
ncbi:MAG TPA: hypothetical protein VFQ61_35140 [Polyangiaceae bacterium]|nr:hypothetical protein [Polyangiaceae bacterium]